MYLIFGIFLYYLPIPSTSFTLNGKHSPFESFVCSLVWSSEQNDSLHDSQDVATGLLQKMHDSILFYN